jgi:hypothetical protein
MLTQAVLDGNDGYMSTVNHSQLGQNGADMITIRTLGDIRITRAPDK